MKMLNNKVHRIYPCGIPQITLNQSLKLEQSFVSNLTSFIENMCFQFSNK